jgi:hypothetical protein
MRPNDRMLQQLPEVKDLGKTVPQQLKLWTLSMASLALFDPELKRGGLWVGIQPKQ